MHRATCFRVGILSLIAAMASILVAGDATATLSPSLASALAEGRLDAAVAADLEAGHGSEAILAVAEGHGTATAAAAIAAIPGVEVAEVWPRLGLLSVGLRDLRALDSLAASPHVASISANSSFPLATVQSHPFINQPAAVASGFSGEGTTVAVLDTGGDCSVIPETNGECPVVWAEDFAEDDGAVDDNGHGTNVGSIVALTAPGTKIASLDVFTAVEGGGHGAITADVLDAIDAVIERRDELNIVAVNLSLGSSQVRHLLQCGLSPYANAFAALRAAGILPVVAAGNQPLSSGIFVNGIADPACAPGAIVVGAVYDQDYGSVQWPASDPLDIFGILPRSACTDAATGPGVITCFSQSGSLLDVFAPGAFVTAGGIEMSGTSQATPHVAAAVAIVASADPSSTVAEREAAVIESGPRITDPRNGLVRRQLELCGALSAVGAACDITQGSLQRQGVPEDRLRYYAIDVPEGTNLLTVTTSGATGDLDLYVGETFPPTRQDAICVEETASLDETCAIVSPDAGTWWVAVYGFEDAEFAIASATSDVNLLKRASLPFIAGDASFGGR